MLDERTGTQTLQTRQHEHQLVTDDTGAVTSAGLLPGEWTDVPTETIRTTSLSEVFGSTVRTESVPAAGSSKLKLAEYWNAGFQERLKLAMCGAMAPVLGGTPSWPHWPGSHTFAVAFVQLLNEPTNFHAISSMRTPQDKLDAMEETLMLAINDTVAEHASKWEAWPGSRLVAAAGFAAAREYMTTAAVGASLPDRSELLAQMVPQSNPMRMLAWQYFEEVVSPTMLKHATGEQELVVRRVWDAVRQATLQSYPAPKNLRESLIRQALSKVLNRTNS